MKADRRLLATGQRELLDYLLHSSVQPSLVVHVTVSATPMLDSSMRLVPVQALPEPKQTWKHATADMTATSIAPALGWFESAATEAKDQRTKIDSLWLVMKFEGLQPAQGFARAPPAESPKGPLAFMGETRDDQLKRRCQYLQALFSGVHRPGAGVCCPGID